MLEEYLRNGYNCKKTAQTRQQERRGASVAETTLTYFFKLWEIRNDEEVHGKSVEQQERTRKIKLSADARKLNALKGDKARPVDMGLFHNDIKEFIDKSTAQTIATFISSYKRAIANSVKKYKEASQAGATSLVQWSRGWSNNNIVIERMNTQQRKDFYLKLTDERRCNDANKPVEDRNQ